MVPKLSRPCTTTDQTKLSKSPSDSTENRGGGYNYCLFKHLDSIVGSQYKSIILRLEIKAHEAGIDIDHFPVTSEKNRT